MIGIPDYGVEELTSAEVKESNAKNTMLRYIQDLKTDFPALPCTRLNCYSPQKQPPTLSYNVTSLADGYECIIAIVDVSIQQRRYRRLWKGSLREFDLETSMYIDGASRTRAGVRFMTQETRNIGIESITVKISRSSLRKR
jgi:hypothetical protein